MQKNRIYAFEQIAHSDINAPSDTGKLVILPILIANVTANFERCVFVFCCKYCRMIGMDVQIMMGLSLGFRVGYFFNYRSLQQVVILSVLILVKIVYGKITETLFKIYIVICVLM